MIDAALFARLTSATASAIIATRAYPQKAPPDATYPLLTYFQVTAGVEDTRVLAGPVTHFRTLQQIDLYARTRAAAIALANAVRTDLDGLVNQTWGGLSIKASIFDLQLDLTFEAEPNLHRIMQQYRIAYAA